MIFSLGLENEVLRTTINIIVSYPPTCKFVDKMILEIDSLVAGAAVASRVGVLCYK